MINIATIIGTGYFGEDVFFKLPWVKYLSPDINLHVASRIKPEIHFTNSLKPLITDSMFLELNDDLNDLKNVSVSFDVLYDSTYIKEYDEKEVDKAERWLGISLEYLSSMDRRFYNKRVMQDVRNKKDLFNYAVGLIYYFKEFFTNNNIEFFITTKEDDLFSLVAYYTSKRLGISVIGLMTSKFPKKGIFFCESFFELIKWNQRNLDWDEITSLYSEKTIAGKEVLDRNQAQWGSNPVKKRFQGIRYINNYKKYKKEVENSLLYEKLVIPDTGHLKGFKQNLTRLSRLLLVKNIIKAPIYNEKYFLFPLHYTEDAQITFLEPLLDQFKLVKDIARALPSHTVLYVKPHPHYMGTDVSIRKLFEISKVHNIKVINPLEPPIKLIKNAIGVITINSTSGFESLIMGTPVITLGHDFYCKHQLCTILRDYNGISEALCNVLNKKAIPNSKIVEKFVKDVYSNTVWVSGSSNATRIRTFTDSDGMKLANALNIIIRGS